MDALKNLFADLRYIIKQDYTENEWQSIIKDNLKNQMPIIYFANSNVEGHCFVIDGMKNDLLHINWGWDGISNGYYSISALDPYNDESRAYLTNHQMVVNIKPDSGSENYSEIWMDSGSDRPNYSWMQKEEIDSYIGRGMLIDSESITSGIPFNLITQSLHSPVNFEGEIGINLMNKYGEVVSTLRSIEIYNRSNNPNLGMIPYFNEVNAEKWADLVYDGVIEPDMYLQLATRKKFNTNWEIVNGTDLTPASIPVIGNVPMLLHEEVEYHGLPLGESDVVYYKSEPARIGQRKASSFGCYLGIAQLYIDGEFNCNFDEFRVKSRQNNTQDNLIKKTYSKVDIFYTPQNELKAKNVHNSTPGELLSLFNPEELISVYKLKISGTINNNDILSLDEFYSLGELDLSDAELEGGILTQRLPYLRVLNLPENIQKVQFEKLPSQEPPTASIINIPKGLKDIGLLYARDYFVLNSQTPPIADDNIYSLVDGTILIVSNGCQQIYKNHKFWGNFHDVIEMDEDDYFNASFKTDEDKSLLYCIITDKLSSLTDSYKRKYGGNTTMPDEYMGENFFFPYRYSNLPSKVDDKSFSFIKSMCPYVPNGYFNGRDFHFMPSDGFLKAYCYTPYLDQLGNKCWTNNFGYIFSPLLESNFSNFSGYAVVPAHSEIGKILNAEDQNKNIFYERYEMISFDCDKNKNLLSITPMLIGISIDKVLIDGVEGTLVDNYYQVDFSKVQEISVDYTYCGIHSMNTVYPHRLIANLPSVNLETTGINEITIKPNDSVKIYTISGIIVFEGQYSNVKLGKGIYIISSQGKTFKQRIE